MNWFPFPQLLKYENYYNPNHFQQTRRIVKNRTAFQMGGGIAELSLISPSSLNMHSIPSSKQGMNAKQKTSYNEDISLTTNLECS